MPISDRWWPPCWTSSLWGPPSWRPPPWEWPWCQATNPVSGQWLEWQAQWTPLCPHWTWCLGEVQGASGGRQYVSGGMWPLWKRWRFWMKRWWLVDIASNSLMGVNYWRRDCMDGNNSVNKISIHVKTFVHEECDRVQRYCEASEQLFGCFSWACHPSVLTHGNIEED